MNEFDEGWSPHGWEQGIGLRVIIQRVGGSIYIEELHSTAGEEHRGFWRGHLNDDTMLKLMKWLAWWGGDHEVRVVGPVPRVQPVITPEALAALYEIGHMDDAPMGIDCESTYRLIVYAAGLSGLEVSQVKDGDKFKLAFKPKQKTGG